ncbi:MULTISPECIES: IS110 family transposase [Legionella]|uniref:IS110 family transposase n=1 Tax=Legionella TaxID=445 RepID=UPI000967784E|nr:MULTISPECIES: IS110 family transposase [Legionella]MBN9228014.1 IS110 family transposase [Legionella steelei]OJW14372.1 MAG: IS110 family transposase [Legionella sp. 39-23]
MAALPKHLQHINTMAAGIDIGSKAHFVAVPESCADVYVREFQSFTTDLYELADWLEACGIVTVAMESTGVYWIPLFELLESRGFEVLLVDARHVKNVSGRKTDVLDCQWLQQLHTYGLLSGAFRPSEQICALRAYMRQRNVLIKQMSLHVQHMQKALSQMNIQLHNVISDITGETGMMIIRAIVSGERDPKVLTRHRNYRCKSPLAIIEKSLTGNYRDEHIFALSQALELFDIYQNKITACDEQIEKKLSLFEDAKTDENEKNTDETKPNKKTVKKSKNAPSFDLSSHLIRMVGVDLTTIPGLEAYSVLKIISEIGLDLNRWKSSKQFASWLGLCPGNKVSGGKILNGKSKRTGNYAASALRMAASTLHHSDSALGAFFRRLKARIGAPKAITATAHKLAIIMFNMIRKQLEFVETGADYYEKQYRDRLIKNLSNRAKMLGFELMEIAC